MATAQFLETAQALQQATRETFGDMSEEAFMAMVNEEIAFVRAENSHRQTDDNT